MSEKATPEMTDVFRFMELRAPFSPEPRSLLQNYIRDDFIIPPPDDPILVLGARYKFGRVDTDLQDVSDVGRLVYKQVFCTEDYGNPVRNVNRLIGAILGLLRPSMPVCPGAEDLPEGVSPLSITELERGAYIVEDGLYYLLPERLEQILPLSAALALQHAFAVLERARAVQKLDLQKLVQNLEALFNLTPLRAVVFTHGIHADNFSKAKRDLFDTLYLLYILRRRAPVNLEHVINGLRVLHILEALSIDTLVTAIQAGPLSESDDKLRRTLEILFPELNGWNGTDKLATLPLIQNEKDLTAYMRATPVIHPIFAQLHHYQHPFNDLKPIGIGDLKVVKQWLTGYLPGEIAHIENVLKKEFKDRTHRRLEKTEESFSFSSEYTESTQKDLQTTDRLELKREVDNIVKTDLKIGANANFTYNGVGIVANVGASFAYGRETSDQTKTADTFWREAINKAVESVQKNTAERRSITKLFETEETNKHTFDNKGGEGHITGIYRWLDKKYKAQLFNFGKRMMFEFIIPEPAAFFVESRLRAFEATLECPQPPNTPDLKLKEVALDFQPSEINEQKFDVLRLKYDLSEFTFPVTTKWVELIDSATNKNLYSERGLDSTIRQVRNYNCRLNSKSYRMTALRVIGYVYFWGRGEENPGPHDINTLEIDVAGQNVLRKVDNTRERWFFSPPPGDAYSDEFPVRDGIPFESDDVSLRLGFWDVADFDLSLNAKLELAPQVLRDWQTQVYNKVKAIEQQRVDKKNQEAQLKYDSQLAEYRNRIAELKAMAVNDLLQGRSEAFNREVIRIELKKHCLTMLTKEFDTDNSDDVIAKIDPIKESPGKFTYPGFKVTEDPKTNTTSCGFEDVGGNSTYPSINIERANEKGRYIQFPEQAFEWQQLAYLFYPYFWAQRPDWIQMMNRVDDADPNLTVFLQAGAARVLLAVTPAYEEAILHFLATREPWEGGPAPVIGDPLFIPLHEELRKRQDDLYNAVPEGQPWTFTLPTSLIFLEGSGATLPEFPDVTTP